MTNQKSLYVILLVMGLLTVGLFLRRGEIILLALPFLTYLVLGFLRSPGEIHLRAWREPGRSIEDSHRPVEMKVTVENSGESRLVLCAQDLLFPSMKLLDGLSSQTLLLAPGEQANLEYTFQAGRGLYAWKSIHVVASDPFSLFERAQDCPAPAELLVRPETVRLRSVPLRPQITRHIPGSLPARLAGSGTNFFGIREYQVGDPLRKINWRMAARYPQKLFTKEFEQDEIVDIGLILDARKLEGDLAGEASLFEHAVCATASLAEFFLREGNRVGLLIFGEKMTAVFPGSGKKHLHNVYRYLAQASARKSIPLEYLSYYSYRLFPRRSIVCIISPYSQRDLSTYSRLAAEGYQVILISPNPVDHAAQRTPVNQVTSLAYRAARLGRYVQLSPLLSLGIHVVDWPVDQPLNEVLHERLAPVMHRSGRRWMAR
jgi:uncharacterized protein (DUF58 family)